MESLSLFKSSRGNILTMKNKKFFFSFFGGKNHDNTGSMMVVRKKGYKKHCLSQISQTYTTGNSKNPHYLHQKSPYNNMN